MITVALLGNSLALSGVGASLGERVGVRVARLDPAAPLDEALGALAPDVLVFDLATERPDVVSLWRRHPRVLPVGLDLEGRRAVVFPGKPSTLVTADDLLSVIAAGVPARSRPRTSRPAAPGASRPGRKEPR